MAYLVKARENESVLFERMKYLPKFRYFNKEGVFKEERKWVKENVSNYKYSWGQYLISDSASWVLSGLCKIAQKEGRSIQLSGQGGDEIISDYALRPALSTFKGKFPDKLFCWKNFYEGGQRSYLMKEENVAKANSVETRYPFLDINVVQEFLWLKPELKNRHYKAPIREYLIRHNFPFAKDVKQGLTIR
jgi:asparagine synthetase B (glutamine-hydrolysing)